MERCLSCFHFLLIMNNATVNIRVQVWVWTYVFTLLGMCLGAELLGHMVTAFGHSRSCRLTFPPDRHEGFLCILMTAILVGVKWSFAASLLCIALTAAGGSIYNSKCLQLRDCECQDPGWIFHSLDLQRERLKSLSSDSLIPAWHLRHTVFSLNQATL